MPRLSKPGVMEVHGRKNLPVLLKRLSYVTAVVACVASLSTLSSRYANGIPRPAASSAAWVPDVGVDVMSVIGTRPEAIKMAPVIRALQNTRLRTVVITTGQHADMLSKLLSELDVRVESTGWSRGAMRARQSLTRLFSRCALSIDRAIERHRPRLVIVQGDTTTALAAAHSAFYAKVPVAHVEAGLRTYHMNAPFPEEFNRKSIASVACFHFAPTKRAEEALLAEGVLQDRIWVTGNTVIDAALDFARRPLDKSTSTFFTKHGIADLAKERRAATRAHERAQVVLLTCHRRENHGELDSIVAAVKALLGAQPKLHVLLPVHPNPAVRGKFNKEFGSVARMHLLPPLSYGVTITILKSYADLVMTDSGGLQEESTSFHVPVVVLREVTERPEGIEYGVARLVGTNASLIVDTVSSILNNVNGARDKMTRDNVWPYGEGNAARQIAGVLASNLEAEAGAELSICSTSGPGPLPTGWRRSTKHYGRVCRVDPFFEDVTVFFMLARVDIGLTGSWFRNFELLMPCYKRMVVLAVRDEVESVRPVVPPYAELVPMDVPDVVKGAPLPNESEDERLARLRTDAYFHQVYAKFVADRYLRDDDTKILFVEADASFAVPATSSCFLLGDKVFFHGSNVISMWRHGTEYALGVKTTVDYHIMRTPVLIYRSTLVGARKRIEEVHGSSFDDLVKRVFRPEFLWQPNNTMFSEFNTLAAYGALFEPHLYQLETDMNILPPFCSAHHSSERHPVYRKVNSVNINGIEKDTACGLTHLPASAPSLIPRLESCS